MRSRLAALTASLLLLPLASCNVDTGDSWDRPLVLASDLAPSALEGRWEGSWQSYEYWDSGLIHFVITPTGAPPPATLPAAALTPAPTTLTPVAPITPPATLPAAASTPAPGTVRYLARGTRWHWGRIFPESFNMVLIATDDHKGQIQFHGERDLGPLNGSCKFDGFIDANKSSMTYVSRHDFGTVTTRRVISPIKNSFAWKRTADGVD